MRALCLIFILSLAHISYCQFNENAVFTSTVNFQLGKGLGADDAGFGIAIDGAIRGKKKLQPLIEATVDRFIGDKVLYTSSERMYKPVIYGIRGGGRYFVTSRICVSVLYGEIWHTLNRFETQSAGSFKAILSVFAGSKRNITFRSFYFSSPQPHIDIRCYGVGAGFRF